jgi:hypothetical protein
MKSEIICRDCGEYLTSSPHQCPPAFFVWCSRVHGAHELGTVVHSRTGHEHAAHLWVTLYGRDAQHIPHVRVTPAPPYWASTDPTAIKWFEARGEVIVEYQLTEIEEPAHGTTSISPDSSTEEAP